MRCIQGIAKPTVNGLRWETDRQLAPIIPCPPNDLYNAVTDVPGMFQINEFPPSPVQELPFHLLKILYVTMPAAYVVRYCFGLGLLSLARSFELLQLNLFCSMSMLFVDRLERWCHGSLDGLLQLYRALHVFPPIHVLLRAWS